MAVNYRRENRVQAWHRHDSKSWRVSRSPVTMWQRKPSKGVWRQGGEPLSVNKYRVAEQGQSTSYLRLQKYQISIYCRPCPSLETISCQKITSLYLWCYSRNFVSVVFSLLTPSYSQFCIIWMNLYIMIATLLFSIHLFTDHVVYLYMPVCLVLSLYLINY